MQSLAQKKARENFKKAIEYRKKTGCSLKQAFAHIKGKKTVTKKVVTVKKSAKKKVVKKVGVIKKKVLHSPLKNKSMKKPISTHKDTKSHNVNIRVVSGIGDKKRAIDTLMLMEKDLNYALLELEIYKNFPIIKGGNLNSNSFKNITQKRWFVKRITNEIKARKKGVSEQYKLIKSI